MDFWFFVKVEEFIFFGIFEVSNRYMINFYCDIIKYCDVVCILFIIIFDIIKL